MSLDKNQLYTSLGVKSFKRVLPQDLHSSNHKNLRQSLEEARRGIPVSKEQWSMALCEELKQCLAHDELELCLESLFKLEHLIEELEDELEKKVPHLEEFYRHLSPSLLRVLWEISRDRIDFDGQKERWLEALRVSLEEELYVWQEKISNKNEFIKKN